MEMEQKNSSPVILTLPAVIVLLQVLWAMRRCDSHLGKGVMTRYAGRVKLPLRKLHDVIGGLELQPETVREKNKITTLDDQQ
ncbi:hypothetical protein [Kordiimonas sp.]|uniref:hypothetical protein n=1 Tax=Kordiimonas sp. TaxID=1970157 RepID=UPI003A8DE15D